MRSENIFKERNEYSVFIKFLNVSSYEQLEDTIINWHRDHGCFAISYSNSQHHSNISLIYEGCIYSVQFKNISELPLHWSVMLHQSYSAEPMKEINVVSSYSINAEALKVERARLLHESNITKNDSICYASAVVCITMGLLALNQIIALFTWS